MPKIIQIELHLYHKLECNRYFEHHLVSPNTSLPYDNFVKHNPSGFCSHKISTGAVTWNLYNKRFSNTTEYCQIANLSEEDTFFFTLTYGDTLPNHINDVHPNHNPILTMTPKVLP